MTETPAGTRVTVGVHRRDDAPGFVVRLVVVDGPGARTVRFPVDDQDEAVALAESIRRYVETGAPLDALLGGA